jgi:hypothetical protein
LKIIFYILILIVGINFGSFAQNRMLLASDPTAKIIKFYPNPAVSNINFEFQKGYDKSFSFQVYNFIGKKVLDYKSVAQKLNIPLTEFYRGVYIYQLRDKTGKIIESGKFQVIK